ncbi:meiosis-specific with OB domain-containing protein-like [Mercenaria mercenaria]|uniref:meiosis-specific with OB domain-containing protein-like n=1 Tax=Mercenaria mercenaria TaxID=6596 RepID=UPI00234F5046|nr:meiosis-specific with OB domain-containing protein-like [Mercenaria mercenaria]XP_045213623.2 meiosis-specific with OB domain-containing protein-like [Mercenaria mercenaria]
MAWSANQFSDFTINRPTNQTSGLHLNNKTSFNNRGLGTTNSFNRQNYHSARNTGSGIQKLEELTPGSIANIIGVVIAKESPRSVFSKKNAGTERFLLGFVIRDSPAGFVNCTCWGSEPFIADLAKSFCIGDVVKVDNAQVQMNPSDGSDEKFRVSSPLGFHLTLSENHSSLTLYNGLDLGTYSPLQFIPIKPNSDYYTLEDVLANGQALNGEHISLLAAVRKIGEPRDITTKAGKHTKRCEIKLFDESCPSFPLVLWGEELVDYAQSWTQGETVLFVADVRMNYDDFRSCMVATADSKTVFTPNPDTVDAKCLYQFALTQNFVEDDSAGRDQSDPPLEEIKDILVVEQIATREGVTSDFAVLYGVITKFDLDSDNTEHFCRRKCTKCKQMVSADTGYQCSNPNCSQAALSVFNTTGEIIHVQPEIDYSVPINISDHTGTVQCRLSADILHTITGWNVKELMQIPAEGRTELKWQYLLERCKFHIKMLRNYRTPERLSIRVMSCCKADSAEMLQSISPIKGR